jgi:uncharacterized protein (TIGR00369 family)
MEGRAAPPPAAVLLGWELIAVDPEAGTIEVAFTASEQFLNPAGVIQGGFLAAMLDDTLGPALVATLGPGLFAPTTDLHVQFLRPARPGQLTGHGRIVRRGREVAFLAGELHDESGQVVATAVATAQVRGVLPAAAVHDLAERPPVRLAHRGQRPIGRVAERDEQRPAAVLGEPSNWRASARSATPAWQLPMPRSAAASSIAIVAWPRSNWARPNALSSAGPITTIVATEPAT